MSTTKRRPGPLPRISREAVLDVARELPPEQVTLKAISQQLGVTSPALYRYFPDRSAILDALAQEARDALAPPDPGLPWEQWLLEAARMQRGLARNHVDLYEAANLRAISRPSIRLMTVGVEVLTAAGFTPLDAFCSLGTISDVAHAIGRAEGRTEHLFDPEAAAELTEALRAGGDPVDLDVVFDRSIAIVIKGLRSLQPPPRAPGRPVRWRKRGLPLGLLLLACLLAGCGTRVERGETAASASEAMGSAITSTGLSDGGQVSSAARPGDPSGMTSTAGSASSVDGRGSASGGAGTPSQVSGGGAGGGPAASTPGAGSGAGGAASPIGAPETNVAGGDAPPGSSNELVTGRGFDEATVNLGIIRLDDPSPVLAAMGINAGTATLSEDAVLQAVVDDINAHGGLVGRQIQLVEHQGSTAEYLASPATFAQSACATFTEDNEVFAVTYAVMGDETGVSCLHEHDVPFISSSGISTPRAYYQELYYDRYPDVYEVGGIEGGRYDRIAQSRLVQRNFFEPWDTVNGTPATGAVTDAPMKLGLIAGNDESGDYGVERIAAELARYNIEITTMFRTSGNLEQGPAENQNAVLQFRAEGITHVMGAGLFFIRSAENQGYRPRYFFEQALNTLALTAPAEQLAGSMGESFIPAQDTGEQHWVGSPSPAYDRCLQVVEEAGAGSPQNQLDRWGMATVCDAFYPMRDALWASGVLSNDGLRQGFTALGNQPVVAVTWTSQFTDTQHASTIGLRDLSFIPDCPCYAYDNDVTHYDS